MKNAKHYLVLFFTITIINSFSQSKQDVLYLKNGSIIKGEILELEFNKSVKIKTSDGSIFVFEFDKILKTEKIAVAATPVETVSQNENFEGEIGEINSFFSNFIKTKRRAFDFISTKKINGASKEINGQKIRDIEYELNITPNQTIYISSMANLNNNGFLHELGYVINQPSGWDKYTNVSAEAVHSSQIISILGIARFEFTDNGWILKSYSHKSYKLIAKNNYKTEPQNTETQTSKVSNNVVNLELKEDIARKDFLIKQLRYNYSFERKDKHSGLILQNGPNDSKLFFELMIDKDNSFQGTTIDFENLKQKILNKFTFTSFENISDSLSHILFYVNIKEIKKVNDDLRFTADWFGYQINKIGSDIQFDTEHHLSDDINVDGIFHFINQSVKKEILYSLPVSEIKKDKNNNVVEVRIKAGKNLRESNFYNTYILGNEKPYPEGVNTYMVTNMGNLYKNTKLNCKYEGGNGELACTPKNSRMAQKIPEYIDFKSKMYIYGLDE